VTSGGGSTRKKNITIKIVGKNAIKARKGVESNLTGSLPKGDQKTIFDKLFIGYNADLSKLAHKPDL